MPDELDPLEPHCLNLGYNEYIALLRKDLGIVRSDSDTSTHDQWYFDDEHRIHELCQYYLDHPEYSRVGREMLIESILVSAWSRLHDSDLQPHEHALLRQAVEWAMGNVFDRDEVGFCWKLDTTGANADPLSQWLHREFPDWVPPRSIWLEMGDADLLLILAIASNTSSQGQGLSLGDALKNSPYSDLRSVIKAHDLLWLLQSRPELVSQWIAYSANKRTQEGWRFSPSNLEISTLGGDPLKFNSVSEAVAEYVFRELDFWASVPEQKDEPQ